MINLLHKINIFNENDYKVAIESSLNNESKIIFFYLNSQVVYLSNEYPKLQDLILKVDYLIPDGYSIVWAYKLLFNKRIKKVVFTYSYISFIREFFITNNIHIFFLGSTESNINKAYQLETNNFNGINIVGFHNGYFDKNNDTDRIVKLINQTNAKVLIVGMGCPLAEEWIITNKDKINAKLIFSVGGFFEFVSNDKKIAPSFLYNSGFEWFFRLLQEPRRLLKRYSFANFYFIITLIKMKLRIEK